MTASRPLRIAVLCPHFAPDTAPTGVVMTRIVHELAALGHELHVVDDKEVVLAVLFLETVRGPRLQRVRVLVTEAV